MKALLVIDMQNDFMPGGNLGVKDGDLIIPKVNELIKEFDLVVATQDWHPANHKSFASQHKSKNPFELILLNGKEQVLWPDHCIQGKSGSFFHSGLESNQFEAIFRKGVNVEVDSYSGFYDNHHLKSTGLTGYLKNKKVTDLYVCGLAADYCVYYSILDALNEGFNVYLYEQATKPINASNYEKLKTELLQIEHFNLIRE